MLTSGRVQHRYGAVYGEANDGLYQWANLLGKLTCELSARKTGGISMLHVISDGRFLGSAQGEFKSELMG